MIARFAKLGLVLLATLAFTFAACEAGEAPIRVERLDHIALTVHDVDVTVEWYERVLGMHHGTCGDGGTELHFGDQKILLRSARDAGLLHASNAVAGYADLGFVLYGSLRGARERLEAQGIPTVSASKCPRGAEGTLNSIYVRDPDGNLVELSIRVDYSDGVD